MKREASPTRHVVALAVAYGLALSVPALFPRVWSRLAFHSPSLQIALETTTGLASLLFCYIAYGRFLRTRLLRDLLILCGFLTVGLTNIVFSALPDVIFSGGRGDSRTWAPAVGVLYGASCLAAAAFVRARRVDRSGVAPRLLVGSVFVLGVLADVLFALGPRLPSGLDPAVGPGTGDVKDLLGHPALIAILLASAGVFALAGAGLAGLAGPPDPYLTRIAAAAILLAFSRVSFVFYPSLFSEWVFTGDALRLASAAVLLTAAAAEIRYYWQAMADAATLEERRRIARDLHDGLAHELLFLASETRRRGQEDPVFSPLADASERALDDARQAISALSRPSDEALDVSITHVAERLANRYGFRPRPDLEPRLMVDGDKRESLLRVLREALTNAARHGRAREVQVELKNARPLRLVVTDDGVGFDPSVGRPGGFGLTSMRERVEAMGGRFDLRSAERSGTTVEVTLP